MQTHSFSSILRAEHYKLKRNRAVLIVLLFPVFISLVTIIHSIHELFDGRNGNIYPHNPWTVLLGTTIINLYSFLYPFLIAILCYSLCDNEYRNDSYKQLFTLPISVFKIYCAKIIYLLEIIFLTVLIAYASYMFSAFVLSLVLPQVHFQDYDVNAAILVYFFKLLISLFTIGVVQYCLSLRFKNFAISIGAGCFFMIFTLLFSNKWDYYYLAIYNASFRASIGFADESIQMTKSEYSNIAYIILFIIVGFWIFRRKK